MDVLYFVNTKKEPAALLPAITGKAATLTDSTISIAQLLNLASERLGREAAFVAFRLRSVREKQIEQYMNMQKNLESL